MNATDYLKAALRTENTPEFLSGHRTHDAREQLERIMHGMIGMATETGELQDQVKKHLIYGKPLDLVNVLEEIGDVLWYCAIVLDACGSSFEIAFAYNIAKLKKRFPDKFTEHAALNRDLDAERKALEGDFTLSADQKAALIDDERRAAVAAALENVVDLSNTTHAAKTEFLNAVIRAAHLVSDDGTPG